MRKDGKNQTKDAAAQASAVIRMDGKRRVTDSSAPILSVSIVKRKVLLEALMSLTTSSRIRVMKSSFGMRQTGKAYANTIMTLKR